jgi:hypothetical protein
MSHHSWSSKCFKTHNIQPLQVFEQKSIFKNLSALYESKETKEKEEHYMPAKDLTPWQILLPSTLRGQTCSLISH